MQIRTPAHKFLGHWILQGLTEKNESPSFHTFSPSDSFPTRLAGIKPFLRTHQHSSQHYSRQSLLHQSNIVVLFLGLHSLPPRHFPVPSKKKESELTTPSIHLPSPFPSAPSTPSALSSLPYWLGTHPLHSDKAFASSRAQL